MDGMGFAVLAREYVGEPGIGGSALKEGEGGPAAMAVLC